MREGLGREVYSLVDSVPDLAPILREHLEDNNGELLPHVFFGDVTRWAVRQDERDAESIDALLATLEIDYANGDDAVRELIVVSFLENLPLDSGIRSRLGSHLRAAQGAEG